MAVDDAVTVAMDPQKAPLACGVFLFKSMPPSASTVDPGFPSFRLSLKMMRSETGSGSTLTKGRRLLPSNIGAAPGSDTPDVAARPQGEGPRWLRIFTGRGRDAKLIRGFHAGRTAWRPTSSS